LTEWRLDSAKIALPNGPWNKNEVCKDPNLHIAFRCFHTQNMPLQLCPCIAEISCLLKTQKYQLSILVAVTVVVKLTKDLLTLFFQ